MKKLIVMLFSAYVFFIVSAIPAFAVESKKEPSNVNITVLVPETMPVVTEIPNIPETPAAPAPITMFPVDVTEIRDNNEWQIIKTYELNSREKPEDIPQGSFERNAGTSGASWKFTLTDILRKESTNAKTLEHTETVTLDTDTKELEKILTLLSPTMDYRADDGFIGILNLDVSSIKVETAGTKTSSYTMTVTREYPYMSTNDTSLVPKTVDDKGKTYTLAGVDWKAGNYVTIDYERVPEYYTAMATYNATGYSTTVTGYTTTAEYSGTLAKMSQGKTTYVAFFLGEEIRTPLEMVTLVPAPAPEPVLEFVPVHTEEPVEIIIEEPIIEEPEVIETSKETDSENKTDPTWYIIIPCLAMMAGGALYFIKKGKRTHNEKTDNSAAVADDDGGARSSGSRG